MDGLTTSEKSCNMSTVLSTAHNPLSVILSHAFKEVSMKVLQKPCPRDIISSSNIESYPLGHWWAFFGSWPKCTNFPKGNKLEMKIQKECRRETQCFYSQFSIFKDETVSASGTWATHHSISISHTRCILSAPFESIWLKMDRQYCS